MTSIVSLPALEMPISALAWVSSRQAARLEKLHITTVAELLWHLPRRYDDTRDVHALLQLYPGAVQTVRATLTSVGIRRSSRRGITLVEALLHDGTDSARAIWFNQGFLAKQLQPGQEYLFSGKVEADRGGLTFRNPKFEKVSSEQRKVGAITPVYAETEGLNSLQLRTLVERVIGLRSQVEDPVPAAVDREKNWPAIGQALYHLHFPNDPQSAAYAREAIAFGELFVLQIAAERARRRRQQALGFRIPYEVEIARNFVGALPFKLTEAQRLAGHEILTDMADSSPMNRLLQGDVGSGKTVVAALATVMAAQAGYQTALMAPTEILARQHHQTLTELLSVGGITPRLLIGNTSTKARREIIDAITARQDLVLVGTHALLEDDVDMSHLGLVIIDEQHRFGVEQRQRLRQKTNTMPNFLAMTATPIPRSLALTAYGDINLSELREMPKGRQPVKTEVISESGREQAFTRIDEQIKKGYQAFVICPIIDESDKLGVRSATAEYELLHEQIFPHHRVELLHGRMTAAEKDERMARFAAGEADILVSTSIVEVGVDVANATMMLIEHAERFGLAQLHQFRGRVGRGNAPAWCLLLQGSEDDLSSRRLRAIATTTNGFDIAELDLRLRGAGDFVGVRQHGIPEFHCADLLDLALLNRARSAAEKWLDTDPDLQSHPPLLRALEAYRAVFDFD